MDGQRLWTRRPTGSIAILSCCLLISCHAADAPLELDPLPEEPVAIPAPIAPDDVIEALEVIYNDEVRDAAERYVAYADLFPGADHDSLSFIFFFQPFDVPPGEEPSWGVSAELESHRNLFNAQEAEQVYSLELDIERVAPQELQYPQPGQENWVEIFATRVRLRLMFNEHDGLLVDGGQARFDLAPADGRWYLTEWTDLPRPEPAGADVEVATWGAIKASFK